MRNCDNEGHCTCWYDGSECCDCGESSDDYYDDYDDTLLDEDAFEWDDDGTLEDKE